jgi:hypothetical protein
MVKDKSNDHLFLRCLQAMIKSYEEHGGLPPHTSISYSRLDNGNYQIELVCQVKKRTTLMTKDYT